MRYSELFDPTALVEGREAPLFHGTGFLNAAQIITTDYMEGKTEHRNDKLLVADKDPYVTYGVSMTRSYDVAKSFGRVIFELDQAKLASRFKIIPIDYYSGSNKRGRHRDPGSGNNEMEEFVVGDIAQFSRYLIAIHMPVTMYRDRDSTLHASRPEIFKHPKLVVHYSKTDFFMPNDGDPKAHLR